MDEATIVGVQALLEENGGQVSGGVISTKFPGTKKAHLEAVMFFTVHQPDGQSGAYHVTPAGAPFDAAKAAAAKAARPQAKKTLDAGFRGIPRSVAPHVQGLTSVHNEPRQPPQLEEATIEGIQGLLEEHGGQVSGGVISSKFPGTKKAQLETCFTVHSHGAGDYFVTLPFVPFDPVKAPEPVHKKQKKERAAVDPLEPPTPLDQAVVDGVLQLLLDSDGQVSVGTVATKFPGTKKAQLELYFDVHKSEEAGESYLLARGVQFDPVKIAVARANKKPREPKEASTEPPPPLTVEVVHLVQGLLEEAGGQLPGGVITTKVPGTKKAQLQQHFQIYDGLDVPDFHVMLHGVSFDPAKVVSGTTRTPGGGLAQLRPDQFGAAIQILEENGGTVKGGLLSKKIPGVKRAQLAAYFDVWQDQKAHDYLVSLGPRTQAAMQAFYGGRYVQNGNPRSRNAQGLGLQATRTLTYPPVSGGAQARSGRAGVPFGWTPTAWQAFQAGQIVPTAAPMRATPAGAAAIDEATVQVIRQLVAESGGVLAGGILATQIPGITRSQLARHFVIQQEGGEYYIS